MRAADIPGHDQGQGVYENAQSGAAAEGTIAAASGVESDSAIRKKILMLYIIAVVLVILWLLGLVTTYTMGGFIHVLLVIAIIVVLLRVISGRDPL